MNVQLSQRAIEALASAPPDVQKAFIKQLKFLVRDLRHPGLHAKKFDESEDLWQGRVTQDWRFYFTIKSDTYYIENIRSHPK
jgi:mRNA-degrading endonuclease RelE of RelBE toxin-antitoxin system